MRLMRWERQSVPAPAMGDEQFRASFDHAPIGLSHSTPDGRFSRVNRKFCEMLGYSEEELLQRSFLDITHPADVADTKDRMARILAGQAAAARLAPEKRYVRKDRSLLWVTVAVALVRDAQDRPHYFITALQDVTERKRAEALTRLEHVIARSLAGTDTAADTLKAVIRAICESESWEFGRYWHVDEAAGLLRPIQAWSVPDAGIERFLETAREVTFAGGSGWVGRTWKTGEAQWVADISKDDRLVQKSLVRETGLRAAFAFPVVSEGTTIGVLAFAIREIRQPDALLLATASAIGSQVGQFLRSNEAEEGLRRFRAAMDVSADLVLLIDPVTLRYVDANAAASRALGYSHAELIALGPLDIFSATREQLSDAYAGLIAGDLDGTAVQGTYRCKNGSVMPVESFRRAVPSAQGHVIVSVGRDITERKKLEERLLQQANYDSLTQLPNRALCYDRLRQAILQAKRKTMSASLLFVDLDRFKAVNDTYGHGAGDHLLQQVSQRLTLCVRAGDTVGRIGGDEFVIILPEVSEAKDAALIARKSLHALAKPFQLVECEVSISASIGIASSPNDGDTVEVLMRNADTAMFYAKQSGRNAFCFFGEVKVA